MSDEKRIKHWESQAKNQGTPYVLGYIAAKVESLEDGGKKRQEQIDKIKRLGVLGFLILLAVDGFFHGFSTVANALTRIVK